MTGPASTHPACYGLARAIAEVDAWLAAQGVRAPERLARLFMPEVA